MAVIKDVAKRAGLSVAAVSKYLNHPEHVTEDTKRRVEEAINELGYVPSSLARSMRTKRLHMIAIVVPDIRDEFYSNIFNYMTISALKRGYTTILYTLENNRKLVKSYLTMQSAKLYDGLISCFSDEDEILELYAQLQEQTPITLMSGEGHDRRFSAVVTDVEQGAYSAAVHLISCGYRRIGMINGPLNNVTTEEKDHGFRRAMQEAGLSVDERLIFNGRYRYETGYEAAERYYSMDEMPDAVFAANDVIAAGFMKYMISKGVRIPEEIGVVGFDNVPIATIYEPGISTVALPIQEMCEESINILIDRIETKTEEKITRVFKSSLVVRDSTRRHASQN